MATTLNEQVRIRVVDYMAAAGLRLGKDGSHVVRQLVGTPESGVQASLRMDDDVIEFGLLERDGDTAINALHCTLVLEEGEGLFHVASDANTDLNYEVRVRPDATGRLDDALRHFADVLRASA